MCGSAGEAWVKRCLGQDQPAQREARRCRRHACQPRQPATCCRTNPSLHPNRGSTSRPATYCLNHHPPKDATLPYLDVLSPHALVERQGLIELLHEGVSLSREAAAPQLLRVVGRWGSRSAGGLRYFICYTRLWFWNRYCPHAKCPRPPRRSSAALTPTDSNLPGPSRLYARELGPVKQFTSREQL